MDHYTNGAVEGLLSLEPASPHLEDLLSELTPAQRRVMIRLFSRGYGAGARESWNLHYAVQLLARDAMQRGPAPQEAACLRAFQANQERAHWAAVEVLAEIRSFTDQAESCPTCGRAGVA